MLFAVGAADKDTAWFEYPFYFTEDLLQIFTVEQYMIGNQQIDTLIRHMNLMGIHNIKGKSVIIGSNRTPDISQHTIREIGQNNPNILRDTFLVFQPKGSITASQFQNGIT